MLVGQRIAPQQDLGAWRKRLGEYTITNQGSDPKVVDRISLIEERGYLLVAIRTLDAPGETPRVVLMPLSDTQAQLLGPLAQGGETVRPQHAHQTNQQDAPPLHATCTAANHKPAVRPVEMYQAEADNHNVPDTTWHHPAVGDQSDAAGRLNQQHRPRQLQANRVAQ